MAEKLQKAEQQLANNQKCIKQTDSYNRHPEQYYTTHNGEQISLNRINSNDSGVYFDADESEALGKSILEDGRDIDVRDEDGRISLHRAVKSNSVEMVKYLIEKGVDFNVQDKHGYTPLYYAYRNHNDEMVKYLIKSGASAFDQNTMIDKHEIRQSKQSKIVFSHSKINNVTKAQEETKRVKKRRVKLKELYAQLNNEQKENRSLKQETQDLKNENVTLKDELERMKGHHSNDLDEHKTHLEELSKLNKENQSLKQKIKNLENENTTLNSELSKTKANKVEKTQLCFLKIASVNLVTMLTVGVIFSVAFQLPILLMIATSVTSALIASVVTYAISTKPTELKEVSIQGLMQHDVYKT